MKRKIMRHIPFGFKLSVSSGVGNAAMAVQYRYVPAGIFTQL